jgi:hypothetical protein
MFQLSPFDSKADICNWKINSTNIGLRGLRLDLSDSSPDLPAHGRGAWLDDV